MSRQSTCSQQTRRARLQDPTRSADPTFYKPGMPSHPPQLSTRVCFVWDGEGAVLVARRSFIEPCYRGLVFLMLKFRHEGEATVLDFCLRGTARAARNQWGSRICLQEKNQSCGLNLHLASLPRPLYPIPCAEVTPGWSSSGTKACTGCPPSAISLYRRHKVASLAFLRCKGFGL